MQERTVCDICSNDTFRLFERYPRWPELDIVQCENCGYVFTKQVMGDEEYEHFYQDYHRKIAAYNKDFEYHDTAKYSQKITVFRQIFYAINEHLPEKKNKKILDVGCYLGSFLDFAREQGAETHGSELDENYVDYVKAKGHACYYGTIEDLDLPDQYFDVITLQEVFEHVTHPVDMLASLRQLLSPGGLLIVEVPNMSFHYVKGKIEKNILKKLMNRPEVGLAPHHHLNHFTVKSLNHLLSQKGFHVVRTEMRKSRAVAGRHSMMAENALYLWNYVSDILYKTIRVSVGNAILITARKE